MNASLLSSITKMDEMAGIIAYDSIRQSESSMIKS